MRCAMCMKHAEGSDIPETDMPLELFKTLAPALGGCEALVLNGIGEPLLHPQLPEMAAFAHSWMPGGALLGFQTNALTLTQELAQELVDAGVNTVCVSVDSLKPTPPEKTLTPLNNQASEIHGQSSIEHLESAFSFLQQAGKNAMRPLQLGIEFVLMAETWRELPDVVRWAGNNGVSFIIVSHMLPYSQHMASQGMFNPNTPKAIDIFTLWKSKAAEEGLDIHDYLHVLLKYAKTPEEKRLAELGKRMQDEATSQEVWLNLRSLLEWDKIESAELEEVCLQAGVIALEESIDLRMPPLRAHDERSCHFVDQGAAFITAQGDVSPCPFLWRKYACQMDGGRKYIQPWYYGNLHDAELGDIWRSREFSDFRREVLQYEYPYCSNCSFVPCDDIIGEAYPFEYDCLGHSIPCGHCLWCMGGLQCLL